MYYVFYTFISVLNFILQRERMEEEDLASFFL